MKDGVAVIKVNNIEVGSMPVSQYEEIVLTVKNDWRTRIASVFSYIGFFWRFIIRLWSFFVKGFSLLCTIFILYYFLHPAELTQFINEMRSLPSEIIAAGFRLVTNICLVLTFISCSLSLLLEGKPLFVSATENAVNKKIRQVMEVPAEGLVSITLKKDGVYSAR